MPGPLVSVVTPSFNQARFLRAALDSVLEQDYPNVESIVMDGGSTDGSVAILESYGERVQWSSRRDRGQADALNRGFELARGEILAWINSDDILLPGAIRRAVDALEAHPRAGFVCGRGAIVDEAGERIGAFPHAEPVDLYRLIHFGDTVLQQSAFFRREAFRTVGGLDPDLRWALDWDLFIRLAKRFPTAFVDEELGAIRVWGETKTATGGRKRLRELGRVIERHAGRRWTPSYWGYALDTFRSWAEPLAERLPLGRRVLDNGRQALARRVLPAMEECSGWFSDGWASPRVRAWFPRLPGADAFEIQGETPVAGQSLRVLVGGEPAADEALPDGRFRLRRPLPVPGPDDDGVIRLELQAARVWARRPRFHGGRQRLAYRLEAVRILDGAGDQTLHPPRRLVTPEPPASVK